MNNSNIIIGIGFRRCGSSYVHSLLNQLEGVSKSKSGSHTFSAWNYNKENTLSLVSSYDKIKNSSEERYLDFSVSYGYPEVANISAQRLANTFPHAKIFCVIRHPVDRLISDINRSLMLGEVGEAIGVYDFLKHNPVFFARGLYTNIVGIYESYGYKVKLFKLEDIKSNRKDTLSSIVAMTQPGGIISRHNKIIIDEFAVNSTVNNKFNIRKLTIDRARKKIISIASTAYKKKFYRMYKELNEDV